MSLYSQCLWSCCCEAEWMDLSPCFVWWYSFSVGCLCLCQCWQAQFRSRPWLNFLPKLLLESIKALHWRTYCPRPSAVCSQTALVLMGYWKPSGGFGRIEEVNVSLRKSTLIQFQFWNVCESTMIHFLDLSLQGKKKLASANSRRDFKLRVSVICCPDLT